MFYSFVLTLPCGISWLTNINRFWMFVAFFWFYSKPVLKVLPDFVKEHTKEDIPNLGKVCEFLYKYHEAVTVCLYVSGMLRFFLLSLILEALMLFVWSLQKDTLKYQINQLTWTIVSLLLVVGQSQFAISYVYQGLLWILLPHGLIMVNDSLYYLSGFLLTLLSYGVLLRNCPRQEDYQ